MATSLRGMADSMIGNTERAMAQMLVQFALQKALGQKSVMSSAYQSAAHTWKNVTESGIGGPWNPLIAAAVSALGTFEFGGVVPKTGMKLVHEGERVLTERQNVALERGLSDGAGGDTHNHYHAAQGESPDSVSRNAAAFRRAMRDGVAFA
jgi:hypothetical protein